jgi:hypothetical protein
MKRSRKWIWIAAADHFIVLLTSTFASTSWHKGTCETMELEFRLVYVPVRLVGRHAHELDAMIMHKNSKHHMVPHDMQQPTPHMDADDYVESKTF